MPLLVPPIDAEFAHKLNAASAKRRCYPFDDHVIDWSVPLDGTWSYMPASISMLASANLDHLDAEQRHFLERWEITQLFRNFGHGEHLLNQGILALLWQIDPLDPSWRYLLHEVAEECQHMAMFIEWVRQNSDIDTVGVEEHAWGALVGVETARLAARSPEAFWVSVLLFEAVGDDLTQELRRNTSGDLHPTLVQIGRAHALEEARHIAYAKRWLAQAVPRLEPEQRNEVQAIVHQLTERLIDQRALIPLRYTPQISHLIDEADFAAASADARASRRMLADLDELLAEFAGWGAVDTTQLATWRDEGSLR
jgi:hypothetical protein